MLSLTRRVWKRRSLRDWWRTNHDSIVNWMPFCCCWLSRLRRTSCLERRRQTAQYITLNTMVYYACGSARQLIPRHAQERTVQHRIQWTLWL